MFNDSSKKVRRLLRASMPITPPPQNFRSSLALRLTRLSPFLLLAAALVALAVFFVNYDAPPASADHGRDTEPWTATLTVVHSGSAERGFKSGTFGSLTDTTFTHAGVDFEVRELTLADDNGALIFGFNRSPNSLKSPALTLHVGNAQLPLAEFSNSGSMSLSHSNPGLSWAEGQGVPVKLVYSLWTGVDLYGGGLVHGSDGAQTMDIDENGSGTFMVRLDQAPTANVTITLQKNFTPCSGCGKEYHGDINAATVSPKTLTFTTSNWQTGQTVSVNGVQDSDSVHEHLAIWAFVSIASGADPNDPYRNPGRVNGIWVTIHDGSDDGSSHGGL